MTTLNTKLNTNEQAVLNDLVVSSKKNGHDFGFTDEVTSVKASAVGAYVASLQDKGWIECYTYDPDFEYGFEFTPAACQHLGIVRG